MDIRFKLAAAISSVSLVVAHHSAAGKDPSFSAPDFAFPRTVSENAGKVYSQSLSSQDYKTALQAAMQMCVADNMLSADSVESASARFKFLSDNATTPWSELSALLNATLLSDYYERNSYKFDSREIPVRISDICKGVLDKKHELSAIPLSLANGIVLNAPEADNAQCSLTAWSVYDFSLFTVIDCMEKAGIGTSSVDYIPFGGSDSVKSHNNEFTVKSLLTEYIDDYMQAHRIKDGTGGDCKSGDCKSEGDNGNLLYDNTKSISYECIGSSPLALAQLKLLQTLRNEECHKYAWELVDFWSKRRGASPMFVNIYNTGALSNGSEEDERRIVETARRISEANEQHDSIHGVYVQLQNIINKILEPEIRITGHEQFLSSGVRSLAYELKNVADCHVLLVPVSSSIYQGRVPRLKSLKPTGKVIDLGIIGCEGFTGQLPCVGRGTLALPELAPGFYAVVPSRTAALKGMYPSMAENTARYIHVCDIACYSVYDTSSSDSKIQSKVYVVDASTNRPVAGARVKAVKRIYGYRKSKEKPQTLNAVTGKDGSVTVPFDDFEYEVTYRGNLLKDDAYGFNIYKDSDKFVAEIYTSLALYRPGATLDCALLLAARKEDGSGAPADGQKVKLTLLDPNYKEVSVSEGYTSQGGRLQASFAIPEDRLTGNYTISAYSGDTRLCAKSVQVAEYKEPTFVVHLVRNEDTGALEGNVSTYSGMPVADASVTIDIEFRRMWWRSTSDLPGNYSAEVKTGADGNFSLPLSGEAIMANPEWRNFYTSGNFRCTASAVAPDGEAQTSAPLYFALGRNFSIEGRIPDAIEAMPGKDSIVSLEIRTFNAMQLPVQAQLHYVLLRKDIPQGSVQYRREGTFTSPTLALKADEIPSGLYELKVTAPENQDVEPFTHTFTIWRSSDKCPPSETLLWIPRNRVFANPEDDSVKVTVGNSYPDDAILMQYSTPKESWVKWIYPEGKNIGVDVPAPADGYSATVSFYALHQLHPAFSSVTILPASEREPLEIKVDTFRDRITPGALEKWQFSISRGEKPNQAWAMAVISNTALDAIVPFVWDYKLHNALFDSRRAGVTRFSGFDELWLSGRLAIVRDAAFKAANCPVPEWNLWGLSLLGYRTFYAKSRMYNSLCTGSKSMKFASAEMDGCDDGEMLECAAPLASKRMASDGIDGSIKAEACVEESCVAGNNEDSGLNAGENASDFRESEMPLALFNPLMASNPGGSLSLDFEVPNFNTTWKLQLLAYDNEMFGTVKSLTTIASKPLMVSLNEPRFLMTSDKTVLEATVFNNTTEPREVEVRIAVAEAGDDSVIVEKLVKVQLAPSASGIASLELEVPDGCGMLVATAKAVCSAGSDGEKTAIPVFPSSTPVIDAETFYLGHGTNSWKVRLPKMGESDKVTLNVCSNPGWYVLTALSGMLEPGSDSALACSSALYTNAVSRGIIESSPVLAEGLRSLLEDADVMESPLQKMADLKLTSLDATPWVNNAEAETARMQGLADLLSSEKADKAIGALVAKLKETQSSSGGWKWMPQMRPCLFITRCVLENIAAIKSAGYGQYMANAEKMVADGMNFADREFAKTYAQAKAEKYELSLPDLLGYFEMRRGITSSKPKGKLADAEIEMLSRIETEWRQLPLSAKASAACMVFAHNKGELANEIIKSIIEFSSYKPNKGRWVSNPSGYWFGIGTNALTAKCMSAVREIAPDSPAIAEFMQFLILSRQTQDWRLSDAGRTVAYMANAVLNSMPLSLEAPAPEILLGGKHIDFKEENASSACGITGNFTINLNPSQASGKEFEIRNAGNSLMWGGVARQYVAPVKSVKAASGPQLKITKSLHPVVVVDNRQQVQKASTTFKKGDKILVTLTLTADRDLDYVLVQDNRGAFLQPKDVLTRYYVKDGIWLLMETRNEATNVYMEHLPAGKHTVTYEATADRDGEYSMGIANAQSQYYPIISAHSAGAAVLVGQ